MSDILVEMATLRKADSKLPVNLYIDGSISYKRGGHSKRIKFQTDKGDKPNIFSSFSSMDLDGNVIAKTPPKKLEIDSKDIQAIKNFVRNNREALSLVSDMDMQFSDFKTYFMIQGGELTNPEVSGKMHSQIQTYLAEENFLTIRSEKCPSMITANT